MIQRKPAIAAKMPLSNTGKPSPPCRSLLTLSSHVSQGGGFIMLLVGYHIEYRVSETLARYLPQLDAKAIKDVKTRLDGLPPYGNQSTALLTCEKESLEWFIRKVKEKKDKE